MRQRHAIIFVVMLILGCDLSKIPGFWKTYEDPSQMYTLRLPRTWEIAEGGLLAAHPNFLSSEEDPLFRANANIFVQKRSTQDSLQQVAELSKVQLTMVLNDYELLSETETHLGRLPSYELRGRYHATEGWRIVRSIIAITPTTQYVFTFSCRQEKENDYKDTVNKIVSSFEPKKTLT